MNQEELLLSIENLSVSFGGGDTRNLVVKEISFGLKRASILALVGESGSGKSVTATTIMGLLPKNGLVESGRVIFRGGENRAEVDLVKLEPFGKVMRSIRGNHIAMIFQNPISSLNPVYSVGDQIIENLLEHQKISRGEARERAISLLNELGIIHAEQRIDQYPFEFSGGMAQRVMIAIAMINNPDLLIADEPTTALDVTVQSQIMDLLRSLRDEQGKSILLITHNMGIVQKHSDEVAVMYKGRIVEFGKTELVFRKPAHPYTRALLNSIVPLGKNKESRLITMEEAIAKEQAFFDVDAPNQIWEEVAPSHYILQPRVG